MTLTMENIAKLANISTLAISLALNGKPRIGQKNSQENI